MEICSPSTTEQRSWFFSESAQTRCGDGQKPSKQNVVFEPLMTLSYLHSTVSHMVPVSEVCHPGQKGLKGVPEVAEGSATVEIQLYSLFEVSGHDVYYLAFSGGSKADRKPEVDTRELVH